MKKTYKHTLLVAASAAIIGFSVPLSAQASVQSGFLQPQAQWAVTNVKGNAPGKGYCAIARRFGKELILTLAKNQRGETSLAMDFEKGNFYPSQIFDITLDPGAGQQRYYTSSPASNKAFILKLGKDESFFEALQHTGYLRAKIDNVSYNFNFVDLERGKDRLEACVLNMTMPAAGGEGAPVQRTDAVYQLSNRIARLEQQNASLKSKVKSDGVQSDGQRSISSAYLERARQNRDINDPGMLDGLRREIRELQLQNKSLQNQMASAYQNKYTSADAISLHQLRAENHVLEKLLNEQKHEMSRKEVGYKTHLDSLKKERNALAHQLEETNTVLAGYDSSYITSLQDQIKALEEDKEMLNTALVQATQKAMLMEVSIPVDGQTTIPDETALMKHVKTLEAENRRLNTLVMAAREQERQMVDEAVKEASAGPVQTKTEVQALANQVGHMRRENERLQRQLVNYRSDSLENIKTIRSLRTENKKLRGRVLQLAEIRAENSRLIEMVDNLRTENSSMKIEMDNFRKVSMQAAMMKDEIKRLQHVSQNWKPAAVEKPIRQINVSSDRTALAKSLNAIMPATGYGENYNKDAVMVHTPQVNEAKSISYKVLEDVQSLLMNAEIELAEFVKVSAEKSDQHMYEWKSDALFGTAHVDQDIAPSFFQAAVKDYISQTQSRCTGDFAVMPSETISYSNVKIDSYEIACVGQAIDSAASLVFYHYDTTMVTIAHETPSADMGQSIMAKEKIIKTLKNS